MSVHNFVHNTPHNSVHNNPHNPDDETDPNPTLISKLDLSHPLHLHPNDSTTLTIVSIKLKGTKNYNVWSCDVLLALEGAGPSQRAQFYVFNPNVNNRSVVQRSQTFGNTSRPNNASRANNNGNKRTIGGPTLVCEHCEFNGYTMDRIKVSHPNGTKALITKVARDNTFIVGFEESKCFLMSQDLMDVKIIRIGKQVNGLYYFDSMEGLSVRKVTGIFLTIVDDFTRAVWDDGSNFIHFSSPTIDHFEDELGHPQGSNGSASEDEITAM
nr:ribonuclease H-like domain-containing protein [Tanacetum cinerariifolium]